MIDIGIGLHTPLGNYVAVEGPALITGANSDMSNAVNDWDSVALGAFDVNTTVPGKLYMLGDGGNDYTRIPIGVLLLVLGSRYKCTLKARLNAGASTPIRVGSVHGPTSINYFWVTPTGTEATYTGYFIAGRTEIEIGLSASKGGMPGIAFELDDVELVEIT